MLHANVPDMLSQITGVFGESGRTSTTSRIRPCGNAAYTMLDLNALQPTNLSPSSRPSKAFTASAS